ncbi:MAG TPA: SsrA-binding protein SmpB [Gemmataceae bacterium]|jgi:SsrA-binding protein|nr:SsrA-binding protein SmpB [Gemmataceae bacterium]
MAKSDKKADGDDIKVVTRNRKASHEYELSDRLECGVVLVGTEVKSLRDGHCSLDGSYAKVEDGELWLIGCEIPEYAMGNRLNHTPKRDRKLLLRRREIAKFAGKASERGFTLVPTAVYFKNGRAKVEIAVAKGKQNYDKRQALKKAEAGREMARAQSRKR